MANDFSASVDISTKESEAGIRQLDSAARDLDKTLQNLHKSLQNGQGDLDRVTKSMTALTKANAELIRSEQERAKATVLAAKADGQMIVNQSKRQKSANDTAIAEAKANKIRQQTLASGLSTSATSTRRDAEARARMANNEAVTQARVASEMARGAVAQQNLATATIRTGSAAAQAASQQSRLGSATRSTQSGTLALNDSLSNSRYLLYDVGQTYTVLAAALQAIPVATAAVAIAYEKDFAQVVRTNAELAKTDGITTLREDLKQLATEIPLTFGEFSNIASIGGQLGIAGKSVGAFTDSVARFGAASNVSLDEAATAFGRLQNSYDPMRKDPDFFNKVGSAIAYVGVRSAATESEIIAVNNQISAAGATFGFAANEIVGLSGALASVRIRPELARGAFQRIMLGLSRAADEGGDAFNKFGKYTGLAADEAQALFKDDPSAFFYKYIGGIKAAIGATGSASAVLDDIGAKNVFDKQFILGLSQGYDVFGKSLKDAQKGFTEGTFLKDSTEGVFNTVDAKLQRIQNSIKNFTDTVGKGSLGPLSHLADSILGVVNGLDRFAQATPNFTAAINVLLGLGSVVGILLAFKAAQAFVLAGLVGFQQVLGKGTLAAGLTAKGILQQVAVTMLMHKGATQQNAQALVAQAGAFKAMGVAAQTSAAQVRAGVLGGIGSVSNAAPVATSRLNGLWGSMKTGASAMLGLVGGPIGALITGITIMGLAWMDAKEQIASAADEMARAAHNGDAAALAGTASALANIKVTAADGVIALGSLNKKFIEVARDAGVPYEKLVKAAQQGENAGKAVNALLDEVARSKGFDDAAAVLDSLDPKAIALAAQFGFLRSKVTELGEQSVTSAKNLKQIEDAGGNVGDAAAGAVPDMESLKAEIAAAGEEGETASEKLDKFIDSIFGMVDAAGNTQSALQGLGESLAESTDFGPGTEGGRANVDAFRDALKAAAQEQQWLIDNTGKSTQQASADYIAFVEGLVAEMTSRGVDPTNVQIMAEQAKNVFGTTLLAGEQPKIGIQVSPESAANAAVDATNQLQAYIASLPAPDVFLGANTETATGKLNQLAQNLSIITGYPYEVVMDALTNPAHEKSVEIYNLIKSITDKTYTAPIGADTSAAVANVRNFASYASQQLAAVQSAYNSVAASAPTFAKYTKPLFKGVTGATSNVPASIARPAPQSTASIPQIAAPVQVKPSAQPNFASLGDGYNKVKDAAKKAGDAGKKAGDDMANGIDNATDAANDYANRLKTGLQSAFDKQYGVQKATDDYYSALNAINKKREDELKQIDDLIGKQKELNDEVAEQMVTARKAGIEKEISQKYGEVDRAADYAQQEQEALNAAEAKRKDIAANDAQIISLRAGIGELNGYSEAAIANREALRNLESKMTDMIVAYANTGASVDQVRQYAANLTAQFQTDVGQITNNRVAVQLLQGDLWRYIGVINSVPYTKPTQVTADVGGNGHGAIGNVQAFGAQADWAARPRNVRFDADTSQLKWKMDEAFRQYEAIFGKTGKTAGLFAAQNGGPGYSGGGSVPGFAGGGTIPGKAPSNLSVDNRFASVDGKGLIQVQSEEFIMQKRAVDFWGEDFMHAINSMKMPAFNGGGSLGGGKASAGSGGPMLVELTAENLQAILRLAERDINLFAGAEQLASTVNEGNKILASKGVS